MTAILSQPLQLPCGVSLANRLAKASMSEGVADIHNQATERLVTLYRRWAASGAGLLLSGNFQVDRAHLERPGNVVVDDETDLEALKRVAEAGVSKGAHFWVQLGHTGRQVSTAINPAPLAPSAVEMEVPASLGRSYAKPRAMTEDEIRHVIAQFGTAARLVRKAGFTGVHIHGAHGYLMSQFLSARSNTRTDGWGGSLEKRARFLLETIAAIRTAVGPSFPIGLKLNSSDFMKGGFTKADAIQVVKWLNGSIDLLELSGGSVEQPKVFGLTFQDEGEDGCAESTIRREAYFVEFAAEIGRVAEMPVMVTGGFRSTKAMSDAVTSGDIDLVGLGRPLCVDPDVANKLLSGEIDRAASPEDNLPPFLVLAWCNMQIERMADGREPDLSLSGEAALDQFKALEGRNLQAWLTQNMPGDEAVA